MSKVSDIFTLFKQRFEELAGSVYLVGTEEECAMLVKDILVKRDVKSVAVTKVKQKLILELLDSGIEVLRGGDARRLSYVDAGISLAEFAIAETGTIVEASHDDYERLVSSLPRIHLVILNLKDIVHTLEEASSRLKEIYRRSGDSPLVVTFISGPSRTGDIELRLIVGVHGPHEVHAIVQAK